MEETNGTTETLKMETEVTNPSNSPPQQQQLPAIDKLLQISQQFLNSSSIGVGETELNGKGGGIEGIMVGISDKIEFLHPRDDWGMD